MIAKGQRIVPPSAACRGGRAARRARLIGAGGLTVAMLCGSADAAGTSSPFAHWHAIVVGIDHYPGAREVPGAVEGANDLAGVLAARGVGDAQAITGPSASRAAIFAAMGGLAARTNRDDVVLLAFGGLGLAEARPTAQSLAVAFRLAGGDGRGPASDPLLTGADLSHFIGDVEARGGRVMLVADAAFGPNSPRHHQPPPLDTTEATDTPRSDGGLGGGAATLFDRSLVLAASDLRYGSASVSLPGRRQPGRLLTYAVARAIERSGHSGSDGAVTGPELMSYAARVVYQLSSQRQQIAALLGRVDGAVPADQATRERGIIIKPTAALGSNPPRAPTAEQPVVATPTALFPHAGDADYMAGPIRIAAASGRVDQLTPLLPLGAPVQAVARNEDPDLIWDPTYKNVLTPEGDLVADDVDRKAITQIIDRTLALRQLKALIVDAPQQVLLLPDDEVKPRGSIVKIEVGDAAGRSLIVFNIRSDGKVQLLYPRPNDPPIITDARYSLSLRIGDPMGMDAVVAVTSPQRLVDLERGLTALQGRKAPIAAIKLIHDAALPGTLVGSVSIFSGRP